MITHITQTWEAKDSADGSKNKITVVFQDEDGQVQLIDVFDLTYVNRRPRDEYPDAIHLGTVPTTITKVKDMKAAMLKGSLPWAI